MLALRVYIPFRDTGRQRDWALAAAQRQPQGIGAQAARRCDGTERTFNDTERVAASVNDRKARRADIGISAARAEPGLGLR